MSEVWPEFGAYGKDRVTLRHVLLHTAGVPGLPPDTSAADLCDWDRMCAVIADATPWWEPGTRFGMVGTNGSAAFADIDSGVAVAVMRNRFAADGLSTAARIDQLIVDVLA